MNLIIEDSEGICARKVVKDVKVIPRKGEFILWGYEPMPKVTKVVYDFNTNTVFVTVK